MATYTISVPNKSLPVITDANVISFLDSFPSKLRNVVDKNESVDSYINKVSVLTNVPANLIKLFMFLTSKGDKFYVSKAPFVSERRVPYGLMGISDTTAQNTLYKESKLDRLGLEEYSELLKNGLNQEFIDKKIQTTLTPTGDKKVIAEKQVNDYDFYNKNNIVSKMPLNNDKMNILVGSMLIGQLIDKYGNKLEQIIPIYMNMDNSKNVDYNWAVNFKGNNVMDLYNKLTPSSKSSINLAMSKGGFLNKFV